MRYNDTKWWGASTEGVHKIKVPHGGISTKRREVNKTNCVRFTLVL